MASDWVKMRGVLLKHHKVTRMARFLADLPEFKGWMFKKPIEGDVFSIVPKEVVIRLVVSGLLGLWDTANATISEEDLLSHTEVDDLDIMAGIPGFGRALVDARWAETVTNCDESNVTRRVTPCVRLPNFNEFNTPDRERRKAKSGAERTAEYRKRRKSNECDESVTQPVTKRDDQNVTPVTRCDGHKREEIEERDRENNTPTPPTPSFRPSEPLAAATAVKSEKAGEGKEPEEFARFREWGAIQAELRNLGMVATEEPIDNLQIQGLSPEHAREIIAYWRSKPKDYWPDPIRALRSKMVRTVEGEEVDAAWLQPSDRYTSLEKANRGEEERQRRIREAERAEVDRENPPSPPIKPQSSVSQGDAAKELEPVYGPVLDAMSVEERDALAIPIYGQPEGFHFQLYRRSWKKEGNRIRRQLMQEIARRNPVMSHSN